MSTEKGMKFDSDKCRLDLIDPAFTEGVGNVLTFGAKKYEAESWKTVKDGLRRYLTAAERHILAIKKGEIIDSESGLPHAYHAATDLMMAQWFIDSVKGPHAEYDYRACQCITSPFTRKPGSLTEYDYKACQRMTAPFTYKPSCFGSNPSPQQRAENECETCTDRKECDKISQEVMPGGITEVSKPGPLTQTPVQSASSALKPTAICPVDDKVCDRPKEVKCTVCERGRFRG